MAQAMVEPAEMVSSPRSLHSALASMMAAQVVDAALGAHGPGGLEFGAFAFDLVRSW